MICPAGRARCARSGHFVARVPCSGGMVGLSSPVGRNWNELLRWYLRSRGLQDAVGDGGCFGGRADVVGADDVGAG